MKKSIDALMLSLSRLLEKKRTTESSTKANAILCPNCNKLISSNEPLCPYCHMVRPGSMLKNNPVVSMMSNPRQIALAIVWLNIFMYMVTLVFSGQHIGLSLNPFSLLSPSEGSIFVFGATGTHPIESYGRWWTVLSAVYLHGSFLHILFNMLIFWQIVPLVVKEYGTSRMLVIYTGGGIIAYIASFLSGTYLTIGASGAVCALVGSLLYYGKSRGGSYGEAIYNQLFTWVVIMAVFGMMVPRVDNWAHGAGLASGIALGYLLGYSEKIQERMFHKTLGMICILVTVGVLLWALIEGVLILLFR